MAELVNQPLRSLSLLHDAFLVVLSDRPAQFVVVHGGSVLSLAPQSGHFDRILDLENALGAVQPSYAGAVSLGSGEEFLEELPEVDVGSCSGSGGFILVGWRLNFFILIFRNVTTRCVSRSSFGYPVFNAFF